MTGDDELEPQQVDRYEKIQRAADLLARRVIWEQGNRIGLLRIHGVVGLVAGLQMLLYGSASSLEHIFGLGIREVLGFLGIVGGLILLGGLMHKPRRILLEAVGLVLLGMWDGLMFLGFAVARYSQHNYTRLPWGTPIPPPDSGYVTPYPIAVYAGMFALIVIHLLTLAKFWRHNAPPAPTSFKDFLK